MHPLNPTLRLGLRTLIAASLTIAPLAAQALPFDPMPSAFERWLNGRRHWPHQRSLRFSGLAQCADQTADRSPYRMAVFTCLKGSLVIREPGQADQQCRLQRVSYFPANQRVRYWTASCRSEAP